MLLFLATIIEQLDLALEHVSKRDVHNARFDLMLTDNAVELFLHQLAKEKRGHMGLYRHLRDEYTRDPIASWQKQAANLRAKKSPHAALAQYQSFMVETAALRDAIFESAAAAEAEIDSAIDRMRGN